MRMWIFWGLSRDPDCPGVAGGNSWPSEPVSCLSVFVLVVRRTVPFREIIVAGERREGERERERERSLAAVFSTCDTARRNYELSS